MIRRNLAILVFMLSMFSGNVFGAVENWSGVVKYVNVNSDGIAHVFFKDLHSGPASWKCVDDWAYLGSKTTKPDSGFLALALTAYTTKAPVRFGIDWDGVHCTVTYISAR